MNTKKFIYIWLSFSVILFTGIASFNYFVDPYLLYNKKSIKGVNQVKPFAGVHSYQSKIHLAHRQKNDAIIIGNSRPEMGINPEHPYFKSKNLNVFNLGQPGSQTSTQYGYALDIIRAQDIKVAVIAVDFIDFLRKDTDKTDPFMWPPQSSQYDKRRKYMWDGSPNPNYKYQYMQDIFLPLISLGTLKDSIATLFTQRPSASNLTKKGYNPAGDMLSATTKEGVQALFKQKIPQLIQSFTSQNWKTFTGETSWSPHFNELKFLLSYLNKHNIETKVFINPYHIHYLDIIDHAGLSEEFAIWKMKLVDTVTQINLNQKTISLWNFSDPSQFITEPTMDANNQPLKWFWEPAHYRKEFGDLIINQLFSYNKQHENPGYILSPDNIMDSLKRYKEDIAVYRHDYPKEADFIKSQFKIHRK